MRVIALANVNLLHERFHDYQLTYYGNDTPTQYIEFETWLFVDLYLLSVDKPLTWSLDLESFDSQQYTSWLRNILRDGFTSANLTCYDSWFKKFMSVKTGYSQYPIGTHNQPNSITSIRCK